MPLRILCMGEALIDFVAEDRGCRLRHASRFRRAPGGAPANVAAGLAKLGTRATFLGMVGEDEFGECLRETLAGCGVDISLLQRTREANTTLAFVSVREDGERSFAFYRNPGADILLRPENIDPRMFAEFDVFHFGSLSLTAEPVRQATLRCLEIARERGLCISYDPNLRPPLWPSLSEAKEWILRGLAYADIVKISEEEGRFLFGGETPELWAREAAAASRAQIVLATLGDKGSLALCGDRLARHDGFRVEVADTTGAGDGFVAGFLSFLSARDLRELEGLSMAEIESALTFANAVGALTCRNTGAIPALPRLEEVEQFLRRPYP